MLPPSKYKHPSSKGTKACHQQPRPVHTSSKKSAGNKPAAERRNVSFPLRPPPNASGTAPAPAADGEGPATARQGGQGPGQRTRGPGPGPPAPPTAGARPSGRLRQSKVVSSPFPRPAHLMPSWGEWTSAGRKESVLKHWAEHPPTWQKEAVVAGQLSDRQWPCPAADPEWSRFEWIRGTC